MVRHTYTRTYTSDNQVHCSLFLYTVQSTKPAPVIRFCSLLPSSDTAVAAVVASAGAAAAAKLTSSATDESPEINTNKLLEDRETDHACIHLGPVILTAAPPTLTAAPPIFWSGRTLLPACILRLWRGCNGLEWNSVQKAGVLSCCTLARKVLREGAIELHIRRTINVCACSEYSVAVI